jgi:hypothetical protein
MFLQKSRAIGFRDSTSYTRTGRRNHVHVVLIVVCSNVKSQLKMTMKEQWQSLRLRQVIEHTFPKILIYRAKETFAENTKQVRIYIQVLIRNTRDPWSSLLTQKIILIFYTVPTGEVERSGVKVGAHHLEGVLVCVRESDCSLVLLVLVTMKLQARNLQLWQTSFFRNLDLTSLWQQRSQMKDTQQWSEEQSPKNDGTVP